MSDKTCSKKFKVSATVFLFLSMMLSASNLHYAQATPIFDDIQTIASGTGFAPQVAVNGSTNIHMTWTDGSNVQYSNSTSGFTNIQAISSSGTVFGIPQLAIDGSDVYVAYLDGTGNTIEISKSATAGSAGSFSSVASIPATIGGGGEVLKISASGGNLYGTLLDNSGNIQFFSSVGSYSLASIDSNSGNFSPQIAANGNRVYVAWENTASSANSLILYENSTDGGSTFNNGGSGPTTLSDSTKPSANPVLSVSGSKVYVAWQEQETSVDDTDIQFKASTNSGSTFGGATNLSNNSGKSQQPQIASAGTNVYVTWLDNQAISSSAPNDVLFRASTNSGSSFASTINLSSDTGDSASIATNPLITAAGTDVNIAWLDTSISSPNSDLFYKGSTNSGSSFGGLQRLNTATLVPPNLVLQASSSTTNLSVVWDDESGLNVFYRSAMPSNISIVLDKTQYSLGETATITVKDPTSAGSGSLSTIKVNSTYDGTGFTPTFTETSSGVFTKTIHFHDSASGSTTVGNATLAASANDVITVTYDEQSAISSIIPITVAFTPSTTYDRGAIAHVTVDDLSANLDPTKYDKINVKITSSSNPSGITMQLIETDTNTHIFGNNTNNDLIFTETGIFPTSGTVTVTQYDNTGPSGTVNEQVTSSSDPITGTTITLTETGSGTHTFKGKLKLGAATVAGSTIKVKGGDIVATNYGGGTNIANAMVGPSNATNGAILVTAGTPAVPNDYVTVTYRGISAQATVNNSLLPGGGSGGVLRASLVVDAVFGAGGSSYVSPSFSLANLALVPNANIPTNIKNAVLNRDPNVPIAPDFATQFDFPLIIDGGGYPLAGYSNKIVTVTEKTNTPVDLKLNIPATNLQHLALYTNLHGTENDLTKSDTYIIYDKGQPLQIVDPHHYFDHVKFDMTTTKGVLNKIDYTITFANPMDKSNIIFRTWNDRFAASDVVIQDAWQVTEGPKLTSTSQLSPSQEQNIPIPQTSNLIPPISSQGIPDVISKIKDWGGYSPNPISDSELLSSIGIQGQDVPNWTEKMAKMVVDGDLTTQEFEDALKYLASIGVVK